MVNCPEPLGNTVLDTPGKEVEVQILERIARIENTNKLLQQQLSDLMQEAERLRRLTRLYTVSNRILEAVLRTRDPQRCFDQACRIAVEDGLFNMAWVGLIDPDTLLVKPVAQSGCEDSHLEEIQPSGTNYLKDHGPTASALRLGTYCVSNTIDHDQRAVPGHGDAQRHGPRSSAAFPLRAASGIIGALTLHSGEPYFFTDEVTRVLESLANAVSFAIDFAEHEKQHEQAEARDISELRRLDEQLLHAHKMEAVGNLAGGIAHDFNNLMTAIIGYSELAINRLNDHELARNDIEQIKKAGQRAAGLTQQLLAFSRRQVSQPKVLDLNAVVSEFQDMLRWILGEGIYLITILDPRLASVKADQGQIEQVLMNLSVNAREAMPQGGKLLIKTENAILGSDCRNWYRDARPGRFVCLSVEDSGVGMDKALLDHIFEPYFTTKELGKGTGLGLSTVYGIVTQHEGWITVESQPGRGSLFMVFLPALPFSL